MSKILGFSVFKQNFLMIYDTSATEITVEGRKKCNKENK